MKTVRKKMSLERALFSNYFK